MHAPTQLADLQAWMMSAIAGVDGKDATKHICPSRRQSSADRLAIYQHAYFARLIECLRGSFPVFAPALGDEEFDQFALGYLRSRPPASYTLNDLGGRFSAFLAATRPPDVPTPGWPDFLIELAELEHTIEQVFDGPGVEELPPLAAGQLVARPADELPGLRLRPAPCLRLMEFRFPVDDFYTAARQGKAPEWPQPATTHLAITRRDYVVCRIELEQSEYRVLTALSAGQDLAAALEGIDGVDAKTVATWFAAWGRLRFFIEVQ